MREYEIYTIPLTIDVIAKNEDSAKETICEILDKAFIYGVGLKEYEIQRRQYSADVNRIFDYDFEESE